MSNNNDTELPQASPPLSTIEDKLEQLYDRWFYKYASEEPDGTYTLVLHEVHDGGAYSDFEKRVKAIITTETMKAVQEATGLTETDRYDKLTDTQRKWLVRYHKMCLAALQGDGDD